MRYLLSMLCILTLAAIVGCDTGDKAASDATRFTEWREVTDGPQLVGIDMVMTYDRLCRATLPGEMERAAKDRYGEHALRYTQTYANPVASSAIDRTEPRRFARRSIIVKGKLQRSHANAPFRSVGIGVMIKREAGYAPDHGDWQYLYFEPGEQPVVDFDAARKLPSLGHCATCHNQAAKQGYVFMPYLAKPSPAR